MPLRLGVIALFLWAALSPQQRKLNLDSFEYVWKTVRDNHWDPKMGGVDWAAVRQELRPRIEKADTPGEARAVLREMLDRLHQTHYGIVPAEVYQDLELPAGQAHYAGIGIEVRVIGGQALVTEVAPDSPAGAQGVRPGWVILAVDGKELAFEKIAQTYAMSTLLQAQLSRAVTSRLAGKTGDPVRVEFLDGAGGRVKREIRRSPPRGVRTKFGFLPTIYFWVESRKLPPNTGYIRFNMFFDPEKLAGAVAAAVKSCARCDGFIIDVRGNPGGIGGLAMGVAGWFIGTPNQRLGTMYLRDNSIKFVVNPRLEPYRGPLAILVDGCSGSTSEIFAGGMKDLKRARIFGMRTAGAALPSQFEKLPNGDGFQYAVANYISQGGQPLEGIGVTPDVEVVPTREQLLAGHDPIVDAAVQWIHTEKKQE